MSLLIFCWVQNPAFHAHPLLFIGHFFLKLPDTFFPQSSHIPQSALELFHRRAPDNLELFRTPPDISNHTRLNFSPWSISGIFDLYHRMPLKHQISSPSSSGRDSPQKRCIAVQMWPPLKSSFPAGVCPATDDPAAPTCRALRCLSQDQTGTHWRR